MSLMMVLSFLQSSDLVRNMLSFMQVFCKVTLWDPFASLIYVSLLLQLDSFNP